MIKKSTAYLILLLTCVILVGCAMTPPPPPKALFLAPDYGLKTPQSIGILPIEDVRLEKNKETPSLFRPLTSTEKTFAKVLNRRGYEVPDPEQIKSQLQKSNITSDALNNANPKELCDLLGVDAVLKSCLHDYEASYKGLYTTFRLEIHFWLLDGKTGETLWENRLTKHKTLLGCEFISPINNWIEYEAFNSLPPRK